MEGVAPGEPNDGVWEDLAIIEIYPATISTDSNGLPEGKEFIVRFEPVRVVAIRVIGTPAWGDGPKQSFASCAEFQGFMEMRK